MKNRRWLFLRYPFLYIEPFCYAICLMIILAIEIAAAIYAGVNRNTIEQDIQKFMLNTLKFYNGSNTEGGITTTWDTLMEQNQCCGVTGNVSDFQNSKWVGKDPATHNLPTSCCPTLTNNVMNSACGTSTANRYTEGCYMKLKDGLLSQLAVVIGVGAAVAAIQLIGIVFAFCLCKAVTDEASMV